MSESTASQPTLFSSEALASLSRAVHGWEEGPLAKTLQRQSERELRLRYQQRAGRTPLHTARRRRPRLRARPGLPRRIPLHARRPADDVPRPPLDHAPVRRLRHRRRVATSGSATSSARARPASPSPSTSPRRSATTPTIPWPSAKSARSASPSTRSTTWRRCSTDIPLDQVSTTMTINAPAAVLARHVHRRRREAGRRPRAKLSGTVQNDVLKEYVARGTYIFPPGPSVRLAADIIAYCAKERAAVEHASASAATTSATPARRPRRRSASAFANAIAYMDAALEPASPSMTSPPASRWIFNTHNNFFEEVAKYRAAPAPVGPHCCKSSFGAKDPALDDAAHPHADRRRDARRPAAREQHRPRRVPGARGRARRRPEHAP